MSNDTPNGWDDAFLAGDAAKELDRRSAVHGIEAILSGDELAMLGNASFSQAVQRKLADKAANAWWERAQADGDEWPEVDLSTVFDSGIEVPNPTVLQRSDGQCLLYAGLENSVFGEAGSGKTAFCQAAAAEEIRAGRHVYLVDFETNVMVWLARFRALGLSDEDVVRFFHYLETRAGSRPPRLVESSTLMILDSLTGAIDAFGFEPNDVRGIESVYRQVVDPFTDAGLAALVIDHVGHADKSRPMNSIRKTGRVQGAMYRMEVVRGLGFGRDRTGEALLYLHKDNMGGLEAVKGEIVAKFVMASTDGGTRVRCQVVRGDDLATLAALAADSPMARKKRDIVRALQHHGELSKSQVRQHAKGKSTFVNDALEELINEGEVRRERRGNADYYRFEEGDIEL